MVIFEQLLHVLGDISDSVSKRGAHEFLFLVLDYARQLQLLRHHNVHQEFLCKHDSVVIDSLELEAVLVELQDCRLCILFF